MPDLLVRDLNPDLYERLRKKADASGKSLAQSAREAIQAYVKPSKGDIWAEIDRIREKIGKVPGDVTADIREDRDSR